MTRLRGASLLLTITLLLCSLLACAPGAGNSDAGSSTGIAIVAAENFYGDIFKQLGGSHVAVTSILSNPNVDPHEYESTVKTAVEVSKAAIVIENGGGYDAWMDRLLSSTPSPNRIVLVATDIAGTRLPNNPHVWYDTHNMIMIAQAMEVALKKVDSANSATFDQNLQRVIQSLTRVIQKTDEIKGKFARTPVGLTEDIYLYQANAMELNVLTPLEFQKAIAEGNDPPADTVVAANNQVRQHQIKVLIYNEQTVTPITTNLQNIATQEGIPIIPITELMPPGKTYTQWMLDQLNLLEQALQGARS